MHRLHQFTCDANLLTFRALADFYQIPLFFIDVPMQQSEADVSYVAGQLKDLGRFLETNTGKTIDESSLKARLSLSRKTLKAYAKFQKQRADKYIPTDLVTPLYAGMTNNILLGTKEEARYVNMLLRDCEHASPAKGSRIYWMHTIPFWSEAVRRSPVF